LTEASPSTYEQAEGQAALALLQKMRCAMGKLRLPCYRRCGARWASCACPRTEMLFRDGQAALALVQRCRFAMGKLRLPSYRGCGEDSGVRWASCACPRTEDAVRIRVCDGQAALALVQSCRFAMGKLRLPSYRKRFSAFTRSLYNRALTTSPAASQWCANCSMCVMASGSLSSVEAMRACNVRS
jgi:hypothetical protein